MDRAEFEASLRQEGYEVREGEIEPHRHREAHAHDFDVRILALDGSATSSLAPRSEITDLSYRHFQYGNCEHRPGLF